jgi:biopolymer transport protein ExbD
MFRVGSSLGSMNKQDSGDAEINMAPLIDMIFILLIFFLVTATFVRESGVEIKRPEAASAEAKDAAGIFIAVTQDGDIFVDKNRVDLRSIRGIVEQFLLENPSGAVMLEADRNSITGRMVQVLDQCRMAGAENIAVSTVRDDS